MQHTILIHLNILQSSTRKLLLRLIIFFSSSSSCSDTQQDGHTRTTRNTFFSFSQKIPFTLDDAKLNHSKILPKKKKEKKRKEF